MNWLTNGSWIAGPVLQVVLLVFMVRRKAHTSYPRFFSYILFQAIKSVALFLVDHFLDDGSYFAAYWTGNAISVLLSVAVTDELLQKLFRQYEGLQNLGSVFIRWSCGLFLVFAVLTAISGPGSGADRVMSGVLAFDRSLRMMQCGLFLLLLLVCHFLKRCWRPQVFGIALGFGIFASIELILVSAMMHYGEGLAPLVSVTKSLAYNCITVLWIGYVVRESESVPLTNTVPELQALDVALLTPATAGTNGESFLATVEDAVERVLSRSSKWPRPSTAGSQVVSRRPEPEERN